jgi:hypothetical protein
MITAIYFLRRLLTVQLEIQCMTQRCVAISVQAGKKKSLHKKNESLRSFVIGEKKKNNFIKCSVHPTALL